MGTDSNARKRISQETKINAKNTEHKSVAEKKQKMDVPQTEPKKKIWSHDTLMQAMQPTIEELEYRKEKSQESNFVEKYSKLFKCTKCQLSIKPIVVKHEKVPTHPCLGVLMCQNCCDYYEDGEFSLDSDGEDKYCRWCGEGGTIFGCSKCICGFCASCIKLHFKMNYFKKVQKDESWLCFFCNPKPLWEHRFICALAKEMSENVSVSTTGIKQSKEENSASFNESEENQSSLQDNLKTPVKNSKKRTWVKRKKKQPVESSTKLTSVTSKSSLTNTEKNKKLYLYTSSSDESDLESSLKRVKFSSTPLLKLNHECKVESFENLKSNVLNKLKKILTLSEHQMDFGITWSSKTLEKLSTPDYITKKHELVKECQKVKHFLSLLSTFLVQFSNSVDTIEKTLHGNVEQKVPQKIQSSDQAAYTNILQFLSFINGQIKMFMEKGMSLPDIFEAEVFDDDKIIGIKKKCNSPNITSNKGSSKSSDGSNHFKSNYNAESKENTDQSKVDELDKIRDDDILEIVGSETLEKDPFDSDNEFKEHDSSNTTLDDLCELKAIDNPKDDIREILAILENA